MYVCVLKKQIEMYRSTTYVAVFLISFQNFTYVIARTDREHVTKCMV